LKTLELVRHRNRLPHWWVCAAFGVIASIASLAAIWPQSASAGEDWTEFRGPDGQGHSTATSLPIEWDSTTNVRWKTDIPGLGWSSPVVLNGRIYLTTSVPDAKPRKLKSKEEPRKTAKEEVRNQSLRTLCVDALKGDILWDEEVFPLEPGPRAQIHIKNSHASPTPILEGDRLYVHFGAQGTACLSLDGKVIWKTRELIFEPQHGNGNSPVLVDDLLFVNCDGFDVQFVAALEKSTGHIRWKKSRPEVKEIKRFAFATPLVIEVDGRKQVVSPAAHWIVAYNPADGEEIWRVRHAGYSLAPRPVYGHGLVFVCTGYDKSNLLAIRPTGTGDVTETHVAWKTDRAAPNTPSPLLVGEELYFISDQGVATCVDAKTGRRHWTQRIGSNFSASPTYADGKIYLESESGVTTILRPGIKYDEVGRNTLKVRTLASFAIDGQGILLRTEDALLRIEEQARGQSATAVE
jgi:outer membrane protein assembly factor BamB